MLGTQPLRHAPSIVHYWQSWIRMEVLDISTNVAWEQFCAIRGQPDYDDAWLAKAPPKNNDFPPRISTNNIEGKSVKEMVDCFGLAQSKGTTILHLLLCKELKEQVVSESEVSVQPSYYPSNHLPYLTLLLRSWVESN